MSVRFLFIGVLILMDWFVVDKEYISYLLKYDSHVGYVEYGDKLKLYVGILLTINIINIIIMFLFLRQNQNIIECLIS